MSTTEHLRREPERKRQKRLLREKALLERFSVGRTNLRSNYVLHDLADPFIPGTKIPRLTPVRLGPRSVAFDEDEVDAVIQSFVDAARGMERS